MKLGMITEKMRLMNTSPNNQKMTSEFAKEVLKYKIQEFGMISRDLKVKNTEFYPVVMASQLNDLVAIKFGIEFEDFSKSLEDPGLDDEIKKLSQQLKNLIQTSTKRVMEKEKPLP